MNELNKNGQVKVIHINAIYAVPMIPVAIANDPNPAFNPVFHEKY
jgi:hypothetical protein